jgi:alkanesulfonate monooxygenase SsuD/methylene tetrahydromethanopterin reductase-like flavin-dependent oxidoreductase (luciferase family)
MGWGMEIDIILNEFASPAEAAELGLLAEGYGIRGVWSTNYGDSRDPFFTLALLADQSSRIRMGPLAVSAAELEPLKMANQLFSLNELCKGRAMLCVGGGGAVLQAIGKERERMILSMRECLSILKGASPDKPLNFKGELHTARYYQPKWAVDEAPQIYLASNYPQSMRVACELADGLMTSDFCLPLMRSRIEEIHAELQRLGRPIDQFRISNFWAWHIKEDAAASWFEARRELILRGYLGEQYFRPFLDDDEIQLMRDNFQAFLDAWINGNDVIEGVPDELITKMIDNIAFAGGLDAIDKSVETLKGFAAAGLTEIALRVHDDPAEAIRLIGEQVVPKL